MWFFPASVNYVIFHVRFFKKNPLQYYSVYALITFPFCNYPAKCLLQYYYIIKLTVTRDGRFFEDYLYGHHGRSGYSGGFDFRTFLLSGLFHLSGGFRPAILWSWEEKENL